MTSEEDRQQKMLDTIEREIARIQDIVRDCSTISVVRRCLFEKGYPRPGLGSPGKQIAFLLGQLLATKEPAQPKALNDSEWGEVAEALERLFNAYLERYSNYEDQFMTKSLAEIRRQDIAIYAFINFFFKTTLATDEQVRDQIRAYVVPFDYVLSEDIGLSASAALAVVEQFASDFLTKFQSLREEVDPPSMTALLQSYRIVRSELVGKWKSEGDAFWNLFTVGRGEGNKLRYPTERSIVEHKPFVRLSDEVAFGCNLTEMLLSIFVASEDCLLRSNSKNTYLKHRSNTLEEQAASAFRHILGKSVEIHRNVFETPDNQNEHDMVIVGPDICLFVEAKSSPPPEPFRDPERAFIRLRRSFRSDTGIQKAYDQAKRLLESIRRQQTAALYDQQGKQVLQLSSADLDRAFCVCVTRDNHGPMATYLSPLLKKRAADPYPWVVSVLELGSIAELWQYYQWGARQLAAYLSDRVKLHAALLGDDELDYVGAYVLHCGLKHFISNTVMPVPLNPTYANIFDDVHDHLLYGARLERIKPVHPTGDSVSRFLRTGESVYSFSRHQKEIKLKRNELCPCGSGDKAKRCHGRL